MALRVRWMACVGGVLAVLGCVVSDGGAGGPAPQKGGLELDGLKASCAQDALPLPAGWRHASGTEAGGEWRGRDRCRYRVVKADLDGDGIRDQAELLVSEGGAEFGPFAFLRQRDATYRVLRLGEPMPREYLEVMGIRAVKPGFYRTACGKGYVACGAGEPKAVRLKAWAIDVFTEESANSLLLLGWPCGPLPAGVDQRLSGHGHKYGDVL